MSTQAVKTDAGDVQVNGPDENGVFYYKGIPYAAPPVGPLRWRPPQPAVPWKGARAAQTLGTNAPQRALFPDIDAFADGQSEDCLFLNIWSSANPGEDRKLPCLFYIHGGGFAVGFGGEKRYDGAPLAKHGIVVITMNYRLNALGLLAHPALSAETGSSGNFAMLDLVAALQWVKRNIASFSGDPDQVTIAGESAGSMFVSMLMASPLARGLYHRAIGESGAQFPSERPMANLKDAETFGTHFAARLQAKTADELRAVPVEAILDANPGLGFWPIVDGHFLTEKPVVTFEKGAQADVPLLAGWNRNEGMNFNVMSFMPGAKSYASLVKTLYADKSKDILKLYPAGKKAQQSARELGADLVINHSTWAWLEAHRMTATSDVFRYRFDHGPSTTWFPNEPEQGAFHSCEIPYILDNLDAFDWKIGPEDKMVAAMFSGYVINFVKTGNPNSEILPNWPSYRETERPQLCIAAKASIAHDVDRARHEMLQALLA
jgi:para-nitrobenzyl esterase